MISQPLCCNGRSPQIAAERRLQICSADRGDELYDHPSGPHEWSNLAAKSDFASVNADLAGPLPKTEAASLAPKRGKRKEKNPP